MYKILKIYNGIDTNVYKTIYGIYENYNVYIDSYVAYELLSTMEINNNINCYFSFEMISFHGVEDDFIEIKDGRVSLYKIIDMAEKYCGHYIRKKSTNPNTQEYEVEIVNENLVIWVEAKKLEGYIKRLYGNITYFLKYKSVYEFIEYVSINKTSNYKMTKTSITFDSIDKTNKTNKTHITHITHKIYLYLNSTFKLEDVFKNADGANNYICILSKPWYNKTENVTYIVPSGRNGIEFKDPMMSSLHNSKYIYANSANYDVPQNPSVYTVTKIRFFYNTDNIKAYYNFKGKYHLNYTVFDNENDLILFYNHLNKIFKLNNDYNKYNYSIEQIINDYNIDDYCSKWMDIVKNEYYIVINPVINAIPINMIRRGNKIDVNANFKFSGKLANAEFEDTGLTYRQLAIKGIEEIWSDKYMENYYGNVKIDDFGGYPVHFTVNVYENSKNAFNFIIESDGRGFAVFNIAFWNFNLNILPIVFTYAFQGYWYYGVDRFRLLCAHEFGHLMGLGDAYGEGLQEGDLQYEAEARSIEIPEYCIMKDTSQKVTSNDIEMILLAFYTMENQIYDDKNKNQSKAIRQPAKT